MDLLNVKIIFSNVESESDIKLGSNTMGIMLMLKKMK